jgi:Co/Zn/Cd efflux system component
MVSPSVITRRTEPEIPHQALRQTVRLVALLNLAYFGTEFAAARVIGSVSLFADSIDFLEDASVNFLVIMAVGWTARSRGWVGMALACILLVPAMATLWTAWGNWLYLSLPTLRCWH